MSTSPRTGRFSPEPRRAGRAALLLGLALPAAMAQAGLRCELGLEGPLQAGRPVPLRLTLHNEGPEALQLLRWNTPFEGHWSGPSVAVERDGQPLPYRGPQFKRGDPVAAHYLRLPAGASASATLDLALPFDLRRPGRYRLQPRLGLADVAPDGAAPRPRAALQPLALDCAPIEFELPAPATPPRP